MEVSREVLILFTFLFIGANCNEVKYVPKITDTILDCDNFDNKVLDFSGLVLGSKIDEEGEDTATLGGTIVTSGELISGYDVKVDIWRMLEMGNEFLYTTSASFCNALDNTDAPWYPIFQSMNITSCPVPITSFEVADMQISLECMKSVMCHEFIGQYRIGLSIIDKTKKISCHMMEISIIEEDCDE